MVRVERKDGALRDALSRTRNRCGDGRKRGSTCLGRNNKTFWNAQRKAGGCRDPHKGPRAARVLAPTTFPLPFLTFPTAVVAAVLNVRHRQQHPRLQQVSRGPPASQVSPALPAAPAPLLATSSLC